MVVIGFDPGSISFGMGILSREAKKISYLHSEEIKLQDRDFNTKMKHLWQRLGQVYSSFPIDQAAIEEGFLGKNVNAMNTLAKVRGVVLASLLDRGIELRSYSPREIKVALTGSGSAHKAQVGKMVKKLLAIEDRKLGSDESDALAVAYCHLLHVK